MSVNIPVSANASGVVSAFNDIRSAISRAKGEAQSFASVDLSQSGMKELGDEVKQVLRNFEELARIGRGATASGVRGALKGAGIAPESLASGGDPERLRALNVWADALGKQYADPAERSRHARNVSNYLTGGSPYFAPPPPPEPPAAGEPGPAPSQTVPLPARRSESFFHRHGRALGTGLGGMLGGEEGGALGGRLGALAGGLFPELALPLLGLAGIQGAGKMVGAAYQNAVGEDRSDDYFMRTIQASGDSFNSLRDAARQAARGLMLTYQQSAALGATFAQLANISDPNQALSGMRSAVGFGRAYGIDAETATSMFGKASLLGLDPERFATLIAAATAQGNDKSQTPQVMQAILAFAQNASRYLVTAGATSDATGRYAGMYAAMQASGAPGLMGDNGAAVLGQINSAIMTGGAAGMPGQVATYQAFAQAGITNPYSVQYDLSGGAFAPIMLPSGKNTDAFDLMRDNYFSRYGAPSTRNWTNQMRDIAEGAYYNINPHQAAAVDQLNPKDLDALPDQLSKLGINASQLNMAALPGIVSLLGNPSSADSVKKSLLANSSLSSADAKAINEAKGHDALMKALVQGLNDTGLEQTDSSRNSQAMANLTNGLTGAGTALVPAVTSLSDVMSKVLLPLKSISTALDKIAGISGQIGPGNPAARDLAGVGATNEQQFGFHAPAPPPNPGAHTRGMRNDNPLDIDYVPGEPGAIGTDGRFAQFASMNDGLAAAVRQIRRYQTGAFNGHKLTSLQQIDDTWTPRNAENPNADADLKFIEEQTGLKGDTDLSDPNKLALYLEYKSRMESGYMPSPGQASAAVKAGSSVNLQVSHSPIVVQVKHPNGQTTTQEVPNTTGTAVQPYNSP